MKYYVNVYSNDTDALVARVEVNDTIGNRIQNKIEDWGDGLGEYELNDLIYDHELHFNFLYCDIDHYSFTFEKMEA